MKAKLFLMFAAAVAGSAAAAAPGDSTGGRVGVYDSRQVAYARFWRPDHQAKLKERMAEGRAARAAGDDAKFRAIAAEMQAHQYRLHLEVFSTAPLGGDDQAWLEARIPAVAREAGVARIVSRWDEAALQGVPAANRVDVTALLVADCALSDAQRKTMAGIGSATPLPLDEARKLAAAGKL